MAAVSARMAPVAPAGLQKRPISKSSRAGSSGHGGNEWSVGRHGALRNRREAEAAFDRRLVSGQVGAGIDDPVRDVPAPQRAEHAQPVLAAIRKEHERERAPRAQIVGLTADPGHRLAPLIRQIGGRSVVVHSQHDVELVPSEPTDQVAAQLAGDVERNIRVGFGEPAEELGQEREREIAGDAHPDRPGQDATVQTAHALVVQRHDLLGVLEHDLALQCETEGLARIREDRRADDLLQPPHLQAHRRLRAANLFAGPREALRPRQDEQCSQQVDRENAFHSCIMRGTHGTILTINADNQSLGAIGSPWHLVE